MKEKENPYGNRKSVPFFYDLPEELNRDNILVYGEIWMRTNFYPNNKSTATAPTLAKELRMSSKTVKRSLVILQEMKLVKCVWHGGAARKASHYVTTRQGSVRPQKKVTRVSQTPDKGLTDPQSYNELGDTVVVSPRGSTPPVAKERKALKEYSPGDKYDESLYEPFHDGTKWTLREIPAHKKKKS